MGRDGKKTEKEGGNKEDGSGWEREFINITGTGGDKKRPDCKEK